MTKIATQGGCIQGQWTRQEASVRCPSSLNKLTEQENFSKKKNAHHIFRYAGERSSENWVMLKVRGTSEVVMWPMISITRIIRFAQEVLKQYEFSDALGSKMF